MKGNKDVSRAKFLNYAAYIQHCKIIILIDD